MFIHHKIDGDGGDDGKVIGMVMGILGMEMMVGMGMGMANISVE